jgi:DHA1 family multidrug resistance protein-like MFS transporter
VKILGLDTSRIALTFTVFGIVGLIAQALVIPKTVGKFEDKKILVGALIFSILAFFGLFISRTYLVFILFSMLVALANAFVNPIISTLLSKETDEKSQGEMMGVNASYVSIGTIVGPIMGGALATLSVPTPFLGGSFFALVCTFFAYQIFRKPAKVVGLE